MNMAQQPQPSSEKKRRREVVEKIEDPQQRHVAFSKRRATIFKQVHSLCNSTCTTAGKDGCRVALIVFSQFGKPYTFANPSLDTVLDDYLLQQTRHEDDNNITTQEGYERWRKWLGDGDEDEECYSRCSEAELLAEEQQLLRLHALVQSMLSSSSPTFLGGGAHHDDVATRTPTDQAASSSSLLLQQNLLENDQDHHDYDHDGGWTYRNDPDIGTVNTGSDQTASFSTSSPSLLLQQNLLENDQDHHDYDHDGGWTYRNVPNMGTFHTGSDQTVSFSSSSPSLLLQQNLSENDQDHDDYDHDNGWTYRNDPDIGTFNEGSLVEFLDLQFEDDDDWTKCFR